MNFELTYAPIAVNALHASLRDPAAGAFCSFEGWVRNVHDGRAVTGLSYHAHEPLAQSSGLALTEAIQHEFGLINVHAVHRLGDLVVGDLAVWVGVSAGHRDAAFAACRAVIDRIKLELPIWKREHYVSDASNWLHPIAS